eukprot:TRINITY_DN9229_c0_g1_i5.p1 TRINITY_DN9229_c0_g1~~TRINITY_DN9229_c0_g1_i5.p1  ORF type:complete len:275 (-),score=109.32 TRINITY_DN9229_c0_g1_i5:66-890(-)
MNEEAKKLLRLMGVPVVEAPCEADSQCAALCKAKKVYATGSEDMDTLTCGSPILLRHLTTPEAKKIPIMEIHLDKVLTGLGLTMEQFIDLCILLGCDYAPKIKGIGPKRALEFIKKYGSIEKIIKCIDKQKYIVPEPFPYEKIREMFKSPEIKPVEECDLTFKEPDEEGLVQFLCKEKGFSEERIRGGIAKLKASKQKSGQSRITSFFTTIPADKEKSPAKKTTKVVKKEAASKKGVPAKNQKAVKKEPASNLKRKREEEDDKKKGKKLKSKDD